MPAKPFTQQKLQITSGATLSYHRRAPPQQQSNAPAVLLLHGLASNRSRWNEFLEQTTLASNYLLLAPDLRGHGESVAKTSASLKDWCADLDTLLAHENVRQVIVVGHSLGAQVALHYAAYQSQQAQSLVLIDPVFRSALTGSLGWYARAGVLFKALHALVRVANGLGFRRRDPLPPLDLQTLDQQARLALQSKEAEAEFIRRYSSTRADLRHVHLAVYLRDLIELFQPLPPGTALNLPVLILLSTGATFADAQQTAAVIQQLPQAQTQYIQCHHWPLTEKPVDVRNAIEQWVRQQPIEPPLSTIRP